MGSLRNRLQRQAAMDISLACLLPSHPVVKIGLHLFKVLGDMSLVCIEPVLHPYDAGLRVDDRVRPDCFRQTPDEGVGFVS